MKLSDKELLNGIAKGDREMIRNVYLDIFPSVEGIVKSLYGSRDDAKDIFQESLLVIYSKMLDNKLELTCSLKTYMCAMAKNMRYLSIRHEIKFKRLEVSPQIMESITAEEFLSFDSQEAKQALYEKHFNLLQDDCKKILKYFFSNLKVKQITYLMKFNSEAYTRTRHTKCKEYLMNSITEDHKYKELTYEPYRNN